MLSPQMEGLGLLIAAGGSSRRFGGGSKLLAPLAGRPVFLHCLERLLPCVREGCCVMAVPREELAAFRERLDGAGMSSVRLVAGGAERSDSVAAALSALPREAFIVGIQDAARPLTTASLLLRCVESARMFGSGVAAHRVNDTIKVASPDGLVVSTPERATLWAAETPQVFRREWLVEACRLRQRVTDDAQAVQLTGHVVHLVENSQLNLKITRAVDLRIAEAVLADMN